MDKIGLNGILTLCFLFGFDHNTGHIVLILTGSENKPCSEAFMVFHLEPTEKLKLFAQF